MPSLFPDEQSNKYEVRAFTGYNQAIDESYLEVGQTHDAQNFRTRDGTLEVVPGNTKYIPEKVPGGCKSLMAFYYNMPDGTVNKQLIASSSEAIYRWDIISNTWRVIKSGLKGGRFDFINYQKGMTEIIIMTNGVDPILKWDGSTITNLGGEPPKSTSIALHYERIWVTGDIENPNTVRSSKDMDPDYWDSTDPGSDDPNETAGVLIDIPTWDGGINIGISTIFDDIVVFKTYSIWKVLGTYPGEYQLVRVFSASGAIAERSIADAGVQCYFLSQEGIYMYDGTQANLISDQIKDIFKNMNLAYRDKAVGVFYDNRYIIAIPEGSSTENNCVIEYDTRAQTWTVRRGFNVNDFLVFQDTLLFSNDDGYVLEYDKGNTFDGKPIDAYWETPQTTLGALSHTIRSNYLYANFENITGGGVTITSTFDDKKTVSKLDKKTKKGKRHRNKGRRFNLRIENNNGSRFKLREVELHVDIDED